MAEELPGTGKGWKKLPEGQGWEDRQGNTWRIDRLHSDHWDVIDRKGRKIKEVDFQGRQIWPGGPKHRGKQP
jgi:hypothetical protein